ncbi:thiol-disulfide oxidoreductase DCC family protein [soil metagenome]
MDDPKATPQDTAPAGRAVAAGKTIVFFDGYCGLCSGVVDYLMARDLDRKLVYAPLQGETATGVLTEAERSDLDTVIVVRDAGLPSMLKLRKSDAVLEAVSLLNSDFAALAKSAKVFPRAVRDMIYDIVARNRFRLFGRRDSCRAPNAEERALFLP